jgi:hypothetical protein
MLDDSSVRRIHVSDLLWAIEKRSVQSWRVYTHASSYTLRSGALSHNQEDVGKLASAHCARRTYSLSRPSAKTDGWNRLYYRRGRQSRPAVIRLRTESMSGKVSHR